MNLPEASGAAYLPGTPPRLLVIADSGHKGQYALVSPVDGTLLGQGQLPLDDGASDDLEDVAFVGDTLYAATSSGWMREFKPTGDAFERTRDAYPLGSAAAGTACKSSKSFNCGPDFEAMCVRDEAGPDGCSGYIGSKATGHLYCLRRDDKGLLSIDTALKAAVATPKTLGGCSVVTGKPDIWIGMNALGMNRVGILRGGLAQSPNIEWLGPLGIGNGEAIVVLPEGPMVRFSDLNGSPSLMRKLQCN